MKIKWESLSTHEIEKYPKNNKIKKTKKEKKESREMQAWVSCTDLYLLHTFTIWNEIKFKSKKKNKKWLQCYSPSSSKTEIY